MKTSVVLFASFVAALPTLVVAKGLVGNNNATVAVSFLDSSLDLGSGGQDISTEGYGIGAELNLNTLKTGKFGLDAGLRAALQTQSIDDIEVELHTTAGEAYVRPLFDLGVVRPFAEFAIGLGESELDSEPASGYASEYADSFIYGGGIGVEIEPVANLFIIPMISIREADEDNIGQTAFSLRVGYWFTDMIGASVSYTFADTDDVETNMVDAGFHLGF